MSQKTFKKTPFLHLTFSAGTGFQYYRTLPAYFSTAPELPKQIRWSLGDDELLARELAKRINHAFEERAYDLSPETVKRNPRHALKTLKDIHFNIKRFQKMASQAWQGLPAPTQLAKSDLSRGYERLQRELSQHAVLYTTSDSTEIIFALTPSPYLCSVLHINFARFDWPLGTSDQAAATQAAIYICAAIEVLENTPTQNPIFFQNPFSFGVLALYEYLLFARPDRGVAIKHIPAALPQALQSVSCRPIPSGWMSNPITSAGKLVQEETGIYSIHIDLSKMPVDEAIKKRGRVRLSLLTCSPIVAMLLLLDVTPQIHQITLPWRPGCENPDNLFERSLQEMADLIRRMITPLMPAEPMQTLPGLSTDETSASIDPAQKALANALGALVSEDKKLKLEQLLFQTNNTGAISPQFATAGCLRLGELAERYEKHQTDTGAWSNPRTQIVSAARLETLCELLGAHRSIDSFKRSDFLALREQLRVYPKNRNRLRAIRNLPLAAIMERGGYETLNLRTAKKVFELARALMSFALDHDLIRENLGAGMIFSTKGADSPRKRTYSASQLERLINGPLYKLTSPPRWRLDDFKFWLPLLGIYTGARLSELSQLRISDVYQEQGVWVISIRATAARQLKTDSSERLVPLHNKLIEMGFLNFHQQRAALKNGDRQAALFDNVRVYGTLAASHVASRWFLGDGNGKGGYLALCGMAEDRLTFHGLRHTFINQFRRQKLDLTIAKALVGHADRSTTGGYGDAYPADVLKTEIDKLDFSINTAHISYKHYQQIRAVQGIYKIGRPTQEISSYK
jgi:integrase